MQNNIQIKFSCLLLAMLLLLSFRRVGIVKTTKTSKKAVEPGRLLVIKWKIQAFFSNKMLLRT